MSSYRDIATGKKPVESFHRLPFYALTFTFNFYVDPPERNSLNVELRVPSDNFSAPTNLQASNAAKQKNLIESGVITSSLIA